MDGAPHPDFDGTAGFCADARHPESQFVPLPGLTAPEGHAGFRLRMPSALVTARPEPAAQPVAMPVPDPQSPATFAEPVERASAETLSGLQQPVMPRPSVPGAAQLAETRAAALAEGQALGRAEADAAMRAEREALSVQARALSAAIARLAAPPAAEVDALTRSIGLAVSRLASERAGGAIDAAPQAFARRIARLAERVTQGMRDVSIHFHPEDLKALHPLLAGACQPELATLATARLVPDSALSRGDADLRAPGLRLADLIADADPLGSTEGMG